MKNFILPGLLFLVGTIFSQENLIFHNESIDKEVRVITGADTVTDIIRYDVAFEVSVPDTGAFSYLKCEFYKVITVEGVESDSIIKSFNVNIHNISTSAYNDLYEQEYFIEGKKIFFTMKALDILPNRFVRIDAYNTENTLLKREIYNLDF